MRVYASHIIGWRFVPCGTLVAVVHDAAAEDGAGRAGVDLAAAVLAPAATDLTATPTHGAV